MASQSAQTNPISRWGSLLQQAVAGVESRLDNILADESNTSRDSAMIENASQPGKRETMNLPATARSSAGTCTTRALGQVCFSNIVTRAIQEAFNKQKE